MARVQLAGLNPAVKNLWISTVASHRAEKLLSASGAAERRCHVACVLQEGLTERSVYYTVS